MGVRAVLSEVADTSLYVELAHLSLVVVVRDLEHLVLDFEGQLVVAPSELVLPMSKVTARTLRAGVGLHEMLTEGCLVQGIHLLRRWRLGGDGGLRVCCLVGCWRLLISGLVLH